MSVGVGGTADPGDNMEDGGLIEDERIVLPRIADPQGIYDVVINGRHVWSLRPDRDTIPEKDRMAAPWPDALDRFLVGHAEVVLRDHVTGTVIATMDHDFHGQSTPEVRVASADGRDLVVDKWGRLIRPLSAEATEVIDELMTQVLHLLETLRDTCGVPAYICYGTLLGAVRDGQLIGHDNDIDIAFVSELEYPVDVMREGYHVERVLRREGWSVRRGSGARLNVRIRLRDGSLRFVDVFTSHWVEGVFYMPSDTGFVLSRETILPLGTVDLMGYQVPAPADPTAMLEATYGPSWRIPDPSFRYETPVWLTRRFTGWFGGLVSHRKYWDEFNATAPKQLPTGPSRFARWVAANYPSNRHLVELGTGTGRDGRWFARKHGRRVTAIEYSTGAVRRGNRISDRRNDPATFELLNLYDTRSVLALGARLAREPEPVDLYARFLLHALEAPGQENVLRLASMALRRGGLLFLEFRTHRDVDEPHVFGEHFRRYQEPDAVVGEIEEAGGRVVHREESTHFAPYEHEVPQVCRIVATWATDPQEDAQGSV